ncbi:exosortase [Alteromonas lipotrueiana]|uniref:exosortase n=1 Tax=Alteromonas lipotrueiana TaxID=2803815 RepID=UPI001C43F02E|nr:exosortase [Alteromonas lipotrueiana]
MDKSGLVSSVSWKVLAVIVVALVVTGLAIPDTYHTLHQLWTKNNETYSHGYILLGFAIYVLVTDFRWQHFSPSFLYAPLALAAGLVWLAAEAVQIMLIQTLVLPGVFWCLLASMVGFKNSLKTLVPVLSLYLALPVMDILVVPLQNLTTWVNTRLIQAIGITAYIETYNIHMPYGIMRIAHGCAGLNYLLAGMSLGIFYSYLNLQRLSLQIRAVAVILVLSLVGNWIRVFGLIMIGYESKMQSELVYDHGFFGWIIFAILAVGFFFYAKRLEAKDGEFVSSGRKPSLPLSAKMISAVVVTLVAFWIVPVSWQMLNNKVSAEAVEVSLPESLSMLKATNVSLNRLGATYEGNDTHAVYSGRVNNYRLNVFVASYRTQKQGKELIYYANKPANRLREKGTVEVQGTRLNVASPAASQRVFWLYKVGNSITLTDMQTKLAQLTHLLDTPVVSVMAVQVNCQRQCPDNNQLKQDLMPQLQAIANIEVR